jgi:predicted ArsR family transcriptional regulator
MQQHQAQERILAALKIREEITEREIARSHQKITTAQFAAAAKSLQESGMIVVEFVKPMKGGRAKVVYKRPETIA